jgi:hypothetical protein
VAGPKKWKQIADYVDEFTMSYHSESTKAQQTRYINNILFLKEQNKRFKCLIMMHNNSELFKRSQDLAEFCQKNDIRYVLKPIDNNGEEWKYSADSYKKLIKCVGESDSTSISNGRACCGGRKLSLNGDLRSVVTFIPKPEVKDWYCSVNWFFLFVQQITGRVYTNKDCRTSTNGKVEPLGNISDPDHILKTLEQQLNGSMPVIRCVKDLCFCGLCAPKAKNKDDFLKLINQTVVDVNFIK